MDCWRTRTRPRERDHGCGMLGEMKVANVRGGVKEEAEYAAGELGQGLVEPRPIEVDNRVAAWR